MALLPRSTEIQPHAARIRPSPRSDNPECASLEEPLGQGKGVPRYNYGNAQFKACERSRNVGEMDLSVGAQCLDAVRAWGLQRQIITLEWDNMEQVNVGS